MRTPSAILLALASLSVSPALASSLPQALETVRYAMSRGYGAVCSLEMIPVERNGYYRCLDVGPYRFVEEYGRTRAFVITPDQPPFEIMVEDAQGARFSYRGPWETNLVQQVDTWYAYEIGGGRAQAQAASDEAARAGAATDAVTAYLKSLEPAQPETAPAAQAPIQQVQPSQPQIYYIMPPGFTPQQYSTATTPAASQPIPSSGVPTIEGIDPPGVLVAPGVVAYPAN